MIRWTRRRESPYRSTSLELAVLRQLGGGDVALDVPDGDSFELSRHEVERLRRLLAVPVAPVLFEDRYLQRWRP